jgi:hypothetical protein
VNRRICNAWALLREPSTPASPLDSTCTGGTYVAPVYRVLNLIGSSMPTRKNPTPLSLLVMYWASGVPITDLDSWELVVRSAIR